MQHFVFCFLCLYIVLRPTQEYFTHMEMSPYAGEGLQILAYTRHLWSLSSEGSFTCQHLLQHGTSSFIVSSEGQETDQCGWFDALCQYLHSNYHCEKCIWKITIMVHLVLAMRESRPHFYCELYRIFSFYLAIVDILCTRNLKKNCSIRS